MKKGFFSSSTLEKSRTPLSLVPMCGSCQLFQRCRSPKMPVSGDGKRKILLVGEAPGETEDSKNLQFVGKTGQLLEKALKQVGINMREDCWLTNSLICRPEDNATPTDKQINWCRPNLVNTVKKLNPEIIVPLGGSAVQSLIGWLWREKTDAIGRWVGWSIPHQKLNCWICPTFHPSFVARSEKQLPVVELFFKKHLKDISKIKGRPWKVVPNYESEVQCVLDIDLVVRSLDWMIGAGGNISFDLETNTMKPDGEQADIVCCSVCWEGNQTIAFPWMGKAIPKMKELLTSNLGKIGWMMKFEDRHIRKHLGVEVNNWIWDGMLCAHILDNRSGISGLKFQAFVRLGFDLYNQHIENYLHSEGGNTKNRIKEVDLHDLLLYCGTDSLLEFRIAEIQQGEFKNEMPEV